METDPTNKPSLPEGFSFSQSNIGDWRRCRRLFQYRHIERRAYPAPETADIVRFEEHRRLGTAFHTLVQQALVGVPEDMLSARIQDDQLAAWWSAFRAFRAQHISGELFVETFLSAPLGAHRLVARYDLIAVDRERQQVAVFDWKTSPSKPSDTTLRQHPQTQVYLYLLVEAGGHYLGQDKLAPETVAMTYWYAAAPEQPVTIRYSAEQHAQARTMLGDVAREIQAAQDFPKVDAAERQQVCRYCVYRNLCWEDVQAGPYDDMIALDAVREPAVELDDFDLDFDQIAEVEF